MSSLISELMRRRESNASTKPGVLTSEPNFNPLAGARDTPPRNYLRPLLIGLGYVALGGVILWQGWQFLPGQTKATEAQRGTVSEADIIPVSSISEISSTAELGATEIEIAEIEATEVESVTPPSDLELGTQDLPPLTPTAPEPVEQTDTTESTESSQTAETASESSAEPDSQPEPVTDAAPDDEVEPQTTPAIAHVGDTSTTASSDSGSATFSSTRRNRELRDAQALYQAGNIDQALVQLGSWLRQDDHTDVRQYYARLLLRAERPESARYVLQPQYSLRELELRAYADFRADAFSDALRHYSELLRRSDTPKQEWYLWVAICHDNLNQSSQAVAMFERYLQHVNGQPDSLIQHARQRITALSG